MKRATQERSGSVGGAVFVLAWGVSLTALYLAFRGETVGHLPALASSFLRTLFSSNPAAFAALFESLAGLLIAALIVISWYGLGHVIVRLTRDALQPLEETHSRAFEWARTCALGAGAWSLIWFGLGALKLYQKPLAVGALLTGMALCAVAYLNRRRESERPVEDETIDWSARAAFFLTITTVALALLAALAPPTAKDALLYHLSLPKIYIEAGGFTDVPYNIASFLPLGAEMQSLWAMLAGRLISARAGEAAAGATLFAFYPLLDIFVYGWARRERLKRIWALMAALLIVCVPTAYHVAASGYIDLALSLYIALSVASLARWAVTLNRTELVYAALALGFALSIKLTAIFVVLPLALVVLLRARQAQSKGGEQRAESGANVGRIALVGLGSLILGCLLASPWYIRTWAQTGSPVYPFYLNIWRGTAPGWDAERSLLFQEINSRYGGYPKSLLSYPVAPFRLSLMGQPEQPAYYDGVLGAGFLFGLPLLIWAAWRSRLSAELKIAAAVAGALFIFWLFSSQQARYLLPALPALGVAMAASCSFVEERLGKRTSEVVRWLLIAIGLAGTLTIIAWFLEQNPLRVVLGGESRRDYLARRLDYYPYYEIINTQLPVDARVWLINMRRDTYHIERPFFSDYMFEDYTLTKYVQEARDAADIRRRAREAGITHVLMRHDVLLDYERSPIVDERLP